MFIAGIVSGFWNPLHEGHIDYINEAKSKCNYLYCIVNNDVQVDIKKSVKLLNQNTRLYVCKNLKAVDEALISIDEDITVAKTLEMIANKEECKLVFFKGGDRRDDASMPKNELEICKKFNIELIYGIGGFDKKNSSSDIKKAL